MAAAAAYSSAILESPLLGTYAILIPSLGVLFAGLVMLKGVFSKTAAYVALATGLTGILFMGSYVAAGLAVLRYINALLAAVFYLLVGIRLYRLSRQMK